MNHLSDSFYQMPERARTTMARKQLKETLLATDGVILSCGRSWNIKNKYLGAGVYEVYLKEINYD